METKRKTATHNERLVRTDSQENVEKRRADCEKKRETDWKRQGWIDKLIANQFN